VRRSAQTVRSVVTASEDLNARLWTLKGVEFARFAHEDWVFAVATDPSDRRVLTALRLLDHLVSDVAGPIDQRGEQAAIRLGHRGESEIGACG